MTNKVGIREYFSRHLLGRLKVFSVPIDDRRVEIFSSRRKIEVSGHCAKPRVVSPSRFTLGKISCVSSAINVGQFRASVRGGKVAKYARGEINVKKIKLIKLKFIPKLKNQKKELSALPQERHNRLKFVREDARNNRGNEMNLAYFYPIIENSVAKLVLNKQDGTLFIWYNPNARGSSPKGLYMCKRMGEKDVDWRWV